jgi:hypothetical protein
MENGQVYFSKYLLVIQQKGRNYYNIIRENLYVLFKCPSRIILEH